MKKKDLLLSSKKYYVTVSENNCRCHQMEQSEMRPHWHDLEYTMKLQPQIPYEHKIYYTYLLILCIHTWNSFYYQNIRWGQRGEGGLVFPDVRIPICISCDENAKLEFLGDFQREFFFSHKNQFTYGSSLLNCSKRFRRNGNCQ